MKKALAEMTHEEWLLERRKGIGGSDAAGVLGISPFEDSTPLCIYRDKRGVAPLETKPTAAMKWGTKHEPMILEEFAEQTGREVVRPEFMFVDSEHQCLLANLDGETADPMHDIVEAKTCNVFGADDWGEPGTDEIPALYLAQVQHYMGVCDRDKAFVAVLIGGNDFRIYAVRRNERLIKLIRDRCVSFWHDNVEKGIPPDPETKGDLKLLYGDGGQDGLVEASEEDILAAEELRRLKAEKKEITAKIEEQTNKLKASMGDAAELWSPIYGQNLATWKSSSSRRLDQKALKKQKPEIYEAFLKTSRTRRFLPKLK